MCFADHTGWLALIARLPPCGGKLSHPRLSGMLPNLENGLSLRRHLANLLIVFSGMGVQPVGVTL